jgi:hypothetical protein
MMRLPVEVEKKVEGLISLDLEGLRKVWRAEFGPPPRLRSVELMRLLLAWRIQARHLGGIGSDLRSQLRRRGRPEMEGLALGVGARLRREWEGTTVEVIVGEDGFHWNGKVYRSLSAVASVIAGCRWNGPRFFGLRKGPQ